MQTFLPSPSFALSAIYLDRERLGKQRIEAKQIIKALSRGKGGWSRHPATLMWLGRRGNLALYGKAMCIEWITQGYVDHQLPFFEEIIKLCPDELEPPEWFLDTEKRNKVTSSHRAALLYKDYNWYSQYGWEEEPKLDYYWPVKT